MRLQIPSDANFELIIGSTSRVFHSKLRRISQEKTQVESRSQPKNVPRLRESEVIFSFTGSPDDEVEDCNRY